MGAAGGGEAKHITACKKSWSSINNSILSEKHSMLSVLRYLSSLKTVTKIVLPFRCCGKIASKSYQKKLKKKSLAGSVAIS
jgi:hypothetical protein